MKETTNIRVSKDIYKIIKHLAMHYNDNMQTIIEKAVMDYKKNKFFEEMNNNYLKLRSDPQTWEEEIKEREIWNISLLDGLEIENESK